MENKLLEGKVSYNIKELREAVEKAVFSIIPHDLT